MRDAQFHHPRLVQVYDAAYGWSREDDFYVSVVGPAPVRVLDMGCGTGRLALALAAAGHRVTGVDPAGSSLDAARAKPGADRVTWVEGSTEVLPMGAYDVALMTSHVAQFLVGADEWARALADLRRSLAPGGRLVFDSRDPADRGWERWNPAESRSRLVLPDGAEVETWVQVDAVLDGAVTFTHHYVFPDEELRSTSTLRFRPEADLRSALERAGFAVERVHGGWAGQPAGQGDGEFIVVARVPAG